ncbi:MAG: hypothetical protein D6726_12310 [Nitrospirae bacterium]|nr:MAG: hypothetical protein D6726_12310 [Nitrospirota bacterium]
MSFVTLGDSISIETIGRGCSGGAIRLFLPKLGLLLCVITLFLTVLVVAPESEAFTGPCSNCHTMHNSQDGTQVDPAGAQPFLVKDACVECHTGSTGKINGFQAPLVLHTTMPTGQGAGSTNAGGDFYWVVNTGDAYGHNVMELGVGQDGNINSYTPPGWDPSATSSSPFGQVAQGSATWGSQLTCAGTFGCHGRRDDGSGNPLTSFEGIGGSHHRNVGGSLGTANDIYNSYRFLGGIKGYEDPDWNWNETSATHNEYYGADIKTGRNGVPTYSNTATISYLCAECHGFFHSEIDADDPAGSPWRRHPTDILLPNSGEYASYNPDNGNVYNTNVPVARPVVPVSSSSTVSPGQTDSSGAVVMCLSCHRAHGSNYPDMLRWNYSLISAGSGTTDSGCFVCHTGKNAD